MSCALWIRHNSPVLRDVEIYFPSGHGAMAAGLPWVIPALCPASAQGSSTFHSHMDKNSKELWLKLVWSFNPLLSRACINKGTLGHALLSNWEQFGAFVHRSVPEKLGGVSIPRAGEFSCCAWKSIMQKLIWQYSSCISCTVSLSYREIRTVMKTSPAAVAYFS